MTGDLIDSLVKETKQITGFDTGTVMLKTDFSMDKVGSYSMPFILIEILDMPDSHQLIGGITQVDGRLAFGVYNYQPDTTGDDTTGYTPSLMNACDTLRVYYSMEKWATAEMTAAFNNYDLRFIFAGITPPDALDADGLIMGYKVMFDFAGFDTNTNRNPISTSTVQAVQQVDNPPFD